ncbi:MAG: histone acetyltransferase [Asticcacaulis sp.]|nr:histone acetyltransferase [Asticcacaulis sp.]MBW8880421.1 histone acetyltransferase [Asticcacaulis sp.]
MAVDIYALGHEGTRIVVIDDFLSDPDFAVRQAAALAPFPDVDTNYYPGARRFVTPEDRDAFVYVDAVCQGIASVLRQIYGVERFQIREAGFSLVTRRPHETQLIQRVPHYDTVYPVDFAVLHYLGRAPMGGTGFYRHRRTGFEVLLPHRAEAFHAALDQDLEAFGPPPPAYFNESSDVWEKIGEVEWRFNRLVVYPGSLFHSGLIADDFDFSPDPRTGRLTGNIFLHATKVTPAEIVAFSQ